MLGRCDDDRCASAIGDVGLGLLAHVRYGRLGFGDVIARFADVPVSAGMFGGCDDGL